MSDLSGPVIYLKLDAIENKGTALDPSYVVIDSSGNKLDGEVLGDVSLVPDPLLGGCVEMHDTAASVQVESAPALGIGGDLTVMGWIKILAGGFADRHAPWILIAGTVDDDHAYGLQCRPFSGDGDAVFYPCGLKEGASIKVPGGFVQDRWYHFAGVRCGGRAVLYLNGAKVADVAMAAPQKGAGKLAIGRAGYYGEPYCRVAAVRVHDRALPQSEIWQVYTNDQALPFVGSYPLSFDMENLDGESVLYLGDDPTGQPRAMNVTIGNLSDRPVYLLSSGDAGTRSAADPPFHHFELRFRPGALSLGSGGSLTLSHGSPSGWAVSGPVTNHDRTVSVFLQLTNGGLLERCASVTLPLLGLVADGAGGSRATRVELRYGAISFSPGPGGASAPIAGSRTVIVNIVNERGKKHSPLHVGFGASHRVLNDGATPNTVTLRIANTSRDTDIALRGPSRGAPSKLILSFDVGGSADGKETPWALGKAADIGACKPVVPQGLLCIAYDQGDAPCWVITPAGDTYTLARMEGIEITLPGIVTGYPSGRSNVYVRYENVPGYWDQTLVCQLEKSPMLFDDKAGTSDAGSGGALLDVNGSLRLRGAEISLGGTMSPSPTGPSDFTGRPAMQGGTVSSTVIGTSKQTALNVLGLNPGGFDSVVIGQVSADSWFGSPSLVVGGGIRARGGAPGGLGENNNGYAFQGNGGDNDSGMFSTGDGLLQFFTNNAEQVTINGSGLVGIRQPAPRALLDVEGDTWSARVFADAIELSRPAPPSEANGPHDGYTPQITLIGKDGTITAQGAISSTAGTISAPAMSSTGTISGKSFTGDGGRLQNVVTRYAQGGSVGGNNPFVWSPPISDLAPGTVCYQLFLNASVPDGVWGLLVNGDTTVTNYWHGTVNGTDPSNDPFIINPDSQGYLTLAFTMSKSASGKIVLQGHGTMETSSVRSFSFSIVYAGDVSKGLTQLQLYPDPNRGTSGDGEFAIDWSIYRAGP